jgi:hypothetical protein
MAKDKKVKAEPKKRADKYEKPLVIKGSFINVIKAAVRPAKKKHG